MSATICGVCNCWNLIAAALIGAIISCSAMIAAYLIIERKERKYRDEHADIGGWGEK